FGLRQLSDLEPLGLAELHSLLYLEDGLAATVSNVNVYGSVLIAVKKESVAVPFENSRHASKLPRAKQKGDCFCRTIGSPMASPSVRSKWSPDWQRGRAELCPVCKTGPTSGVCPSHCQLTGSRTAVFDCRPR